MIPKSEPLFPEYFCIETTNKCNLHCVMCPRDTMTRAEGTMDMELYRKIVEDCSNFVEHILGFDVFMDGEPLLDNLLEERIKIAKNAGIRFVEIATNGTLLTKSRAKTLIESGLDNIIISLEDIDKDVHERIRRGSNYNKIISNLENLIAIRNEAGSTTPQITVRMLGFEENTSRREAFLEHWKTKVEQVIVQPLHNFGGGAEPFGKKVIHPNRECDYLWTTMVILVDGTVPLCCLDYDGVHRLGNARHESVYDIWHGEKFKEYRERFRNCQIDMCNHCDWIPGSSITHIVNGRVIKDDDKKKEPKIEWTGERFLPWIEGAQIHYEHLHRYAFAAHFVKGKKVLDLACGEGYGTYMLAREAAYIAGVEIDEPTVQHARSRYIKDNLEFMEGSILAVPIESERKFDVVVCFEALEHIAEHDELLSEVKRLLKDDGLFIVSTPNKAVYTDEPDYYNPFHVKELRFDEFSSLLRRYFKHLYIFGQRVYAGSNMWSIHEHKSPGYIEEVIRKGDTEFYSTEITSKEPVYFIALASNASLKPLTSITDSWLIDVSSTLFNDHERRLAELNHDVETRDARIGRLERSLQEKVALIDNLGRSLQEKVALIDNLGRSLQEKVAQISNFEKSLDEKVAQIHSLELQIQRIQHSIPMQLVNRYQRIVEKLLRPGTRRRYYYELGLTGIRVILNEGWHSFWLNYKRYRNRGKPVPTKVSDRDIAVILAQPEEKVSLIDRHVTVVIPTRNAGPDFEFTLEHLTNAKGIAALETLVVDSGSTDCTIELAEKYSARVFKIRPDEFNHGLTRNFGVTQAGGDYVLFMVQDAIPVGDRWLYEMVRVMENDSGIAATTCRQVPRSDADLFACSNLWNHYRQLGFSRDVVCSAPPGFHKLAPLERRKLAGLDNVCCLVKRTVFDNLKFKEMSYAEDLDLGLRLLENGYKVSFLQSAAVVHSHNRTATYIMKRSYVEAKLLPTILGYQPPQFIDQGDVEFMFGSVMMLYAALNAAVQSVTSYSEPADRLCSRIKSSIRENFSRSPEALKEFEKAGGHLDVVFDEIRGLVGESSMVPTISLAHHYLPMLDNFTLYLNVYTTIEDKKDEFVESLYKLLAISAGTAFGSHFLAASKRGEQNKALAAVDAYLSEGV
jgi:MoaA/NifB/PqqE/SkfB family radical SAM enzyme/SAM-dependent methyltransferase/glycosyltransferase involved in cell wall biosynthesis